MKTKEMKSKSLSEVLEFGNGEIISACSQNSDIFFADEEIILLVCQTL